MLDWIFEVIVKWAASVASELMDTVSGIFLNALGTDMTAMEEYFPFVTKAFTVMQRINLSGCAVLTAAARWCSEARTASTGRQPGSHTLCVLPIS